MAPSINLNTSLDSLKALSQSLTGLDHNTPNKEAILNEIRGIVTFIQVFQQNKQVNNQISYQNLLRLECLRLQEMLESSLESDDTVAKDIPLLQEGQTSLQRISKDITEIYKLYEPENLEEKIRTIKFDLPWMGNSGYLTFKTPELLGRIISSLCEARMSMSGKNSVKFQIYLPPLTESEAEQMKNTGETREALETKYAKISFEAAAKQGFSPDQCNISINGVTVSPKEGRFTGLYEDWKSKAQEKQNQLVKETWKNTLKQPAPEVETLKRRKP